MKALVSSRDLKQITTAKFIAFAVATVTIVLVGAFLVLLGADLYVHRKFDKAAGLNIWGYRGPVLGRKQPNEIRVAVIGGSTALGFGLPWTDAFPHQLEVALNRSEAARTRHFVVANLGYNNNGAYSFRYTLEDYEYLSYDVVCFYEGYNDLNDMTNVRVSRRDSGIFRWTGYYPLLPTVAIEKAMQLRHGGDLRAAYWGRPVVFRPNFADRTKASALETSMAILNALEQRVDSGELRKIELPVELSEGCGKRWAVYCHSVALAVAEARKMGKAVLVVTQPYIKDIHRDQQRALKGMLSARWGGDPWVRHVDLGDAVDLKDETLCWDGMHLTPAGNQKIAGGLVQPVLDAVPLVER